ncbi:MAG: glycosyltransferase family 2 protein [Patescibacteria group bacterium]
MNLPKIAIVVINLNEKKLLKNCLDSLNKNSYPKDKIRIIVVDNGSSDSSLKFLKEKTKVTLISNSSNLGFAKANNQGIERALKDKKVKYIITLNNDTEVEKSWLKNLINFMDKNKGVGIAAGKMLKLKKKDIIDSAGDYFSKLNYRVVNRGSYDNDRGQYEKTEEALSACAAASIIRREVLIDCKIGNEFFDEDFVSYIEDVDLNIRARLLGWKSSYVPSAIVYHVGSATFSKMSLEIKEYYSRRNRILMAIKNFPIKQMSYLLYKYVLPSKKGLSYYPLKKGNVNKSETKKLSFKDATLVQLRAIAGALKLLPAIIKKRHEIAEKKKIDDREVERWFKDLTI